MAVLLILLITAARIFFDFSFTRKGRRLPFLKGQVFDGPDLRAWKKFADIHEADHAWLQSQPFTRVTVKASDGIHLHGRFFEAKDASRIVICAHGYRGEALYDFAGAGRYLLGHNSSLLLIDHRAQGESEGEYITFGALEKKDIALWAEYCKAHNPNHLPVYLYGISMGAASVLLASGEEISCPISGIIADCGYSSIYSILLAQGRRFTGAATALIMQVMEGICRRKAGFVFRDGDVENTLRSCRIPVLFVHGSEDHFVPIENSERNYAACSSKKQFVIIEGAVHASSYYTDPDRYASALETFFASEDGQAAR